MVVVGHVDAGKSTLMGQLLVSSGVVATKEARRFQKEANAMGKGSFYLAWVMDEGEDERAHGVTIEVAEKVKARLYLFSRRLFFPTLRLYMLLHM
jgi:elongation factor 1 alpha-like protein